ncbi:hypothetical protein Bpfe_030143 [Biomphalaria pfeifferi]|uniref:Uncharacterized protein n=1 Tax=Biomphalaria pfeifferi TaxID=112525 RepID=A0AAD8EV10_BIOPF|nr:hypothetical protein Bpfe_030143 [Biomphalaria pfeifferi]
MLLELVMVTSSHIVLENESIHRPLMEKHYVSEIVKLMTSFPENKTMQDQGCKIIGNLAVRGDLRKLVENEGASKAIVAAMLALKEIREIQEVGCLALVNLTCDCRVNKIRAIHCGAVTTILQTISGFKKEMTLAVCALKALSTLVTEDEACHQILENRGLHLLKSLVHSFQSNSDILSDTALVLSRLAVLPAVQSIHLNIIDTLLSSIWSFGQNDDHVVHTLCHSFENLSKTDSGRKLLATNQRLDIVLHMMNQYTKSALIQSTGCRIIAISSLYVSNKESILTETAVKCVLSSMELFPLDFDVILVGCVTLTCIIQQMEKLKEKCLAFGGVFRIEQAVRSHTNDPRLALVAVLALGQLMPIVRNSQKYPKERYLTCSIILSCLNRFTNNKEIWISGCQVLSKTVLSDSCLADVKKSITKMPRQLNCDPEIRVVIDKIFRTQNTTIIRL